MADNTVLNSGTGGDTIATDEISGVKYPRSKITLGADGTNDGDVSLSNPMPVSLTTVPSHAVTNAGTFAVQSAQSGTWTISLPTGAATSALQSTGNTSVASIDTKTPTLGQALAAASVPVVMTAAQLSTLTPLATVAATQSGSWSVTVAAGSAVIGHVIIDSGTVASTQSGTWTVQPGNTANTTAWKVDGSAVTQPVSGTVSITSNSAVNVAQINGVTTLMGNGVTGTGSQRVTIASDNTAFSVNAAQSGTWTVQPGNTANTTAWKVDGSAVTQPVSGTVSITSNSAVNVAQINAVTPLMGNGVTGTGSQRVTIASDNTAFSVNAAQSGTWNIGTVTTVTNLSQLGGVAIAMNTGVRSTGTQRVTIATDDIVPCSQSGTWTVQPGNTANTTAWLANPKDPAATTGTITAVDAATTSADNNNGVAVLSGTPTAGSSVSCTLAGHTSVSVEISGNGVGTFVFERSQDGGTNWITHSLDIVSLGTLVSSAVRTTNVPQLFRGSAGTLTTFRVRCTTYTSGTLTVNIQPSYGVVNVPVTQVGSPWTVTANAGTGTLNVAEQAATSGGSSVSSFLSTAAVQTTAVKASAGQVYAIEFFNIGSTPMYVRLYNMTTAPASTDGANIIWRGIIPGNTAGAGIVKTWPNGLVFSTGIGMRCTGLIADNDATVLAANTVIGNVCFK